MIEFAEVTFAYGRTGGPPVLDRLSFRIGRGEMVALIGQNGAGKTTILKHMIGLLRPERGTVTVDGINTARAPVSLLARRVGFLFQNPDHQIFHPTVAGEIAFGPANLGVTGRKLDELVRQAAAAAGLDKFLSYAPHSLGRGLRQRVALASVLAMQPEILILDEPTTGQDEVESGEIMAIIDGLHAQGRTVVMVTHDMELVYGHARRVLVLARGRLAMDGNPDEVFSQGERLAEAGVEAPVSYRLRRLGFPATGTNSGSRKERGGHVAAG